MIEILSTLPLNTVQDLGRFGSRHYGVSTSGVMDPIAFVVGNVLLGNPDNAAAIEVQTFPFVVRFLADTNFAVTGADTAATLDDRDVPPWWSATARRGQTLTLRPPASGARAYLALAGGVDVPVILGSRSTHLRSEFGGFGGRSLEQGDVLRTLDSETSPWKSDGLGVVPPSFALPSTTCTPRRFRSGSGRPNGRSRTTAIAAVIGFPAAHSSSLRRSSCAPTGWLLASSRCRRPVSRSSN